MNDGSNQFNNNHQVYTDGSQGYTEEEGHYDVNNTTNNHNQGGQGLPPPPLFHGSDYHPQQYNGGSNSMGHELDNGQYRYDNMPEVTNQYHQQQHNSGAPYEQSVKEVELMMPLARKVITRSTPSSLLHLPPIITDRRS